MAVAASSVDTAPPSSLVPFAMGSTFLNRPDEDLRQTPNDALITLAAEPDGTNPNGQQDATFLNEIPSNSQSDAEARRNDQPPRVMNQNQSEEFQTTGTAFGSKSLNNSDERAPPQLEGPPQAINPFAAALPHDEYFSFTPLNASPVDISDTQVNSKFISPGFAALQQRQPQLGLSQSPNPMLMQKIIIPPVSSHSKQDGKQESHQEIAVTDQGRVNKNPISRNTNEFGKPPLELKLSDDEQDGGGGGSARAETPIHPNQVVDGITFTQVEDPTYSAAEMFEHCADSDHEPIKAFNTQPHGAPQATADQMNSTGKEFFKSSNQNSRVEVSGFGSNAANSISISATQAAQIQKSSIKILKQLQKKKQSAGNASGGATGSTGAKPHHGARVVVANNSPFFLKKTKAQPVQQFITQQPSNAPGLSVDNFANLIKQQQDKAQERSANKRSHKKQVTSLIPQSIAHIQDYADGLGATPESGVYAVNAPKQTQQAFANRHASSQQLVQQ